LAARELRLAAHEHATIRGFALDLFTRTRAELLEHIETAITVRAVNPRGTSFLIDTPEVLIAGEAGDLDRVVGIGDIERMPSEYQDTRRRSPRFSPFNAFCSAQPTNRTISRRSTLASASTD